MRISLIFLLGLLSFNLVFAQEYTTGLNFDDEEYAKIPRKAPLTRGLYVEAMPTAISLKKYCPTPMSQGSYGTCVGWSTNWAARTIVEAIRNNWNSRDQISQNTFSPGYVYQQIKDRNDVNCSFGTSIHDALNYMKFNGSVHYSDFDQSCASEVPMHLKEKEKAFKIKDFARIFSIDQSSNFKIQATKKGLSENYPIIIGMKCPPSFFKAKGAWQPEEDPKGSFGGHAMCVIGYDDSKYGGAFEIMNSWGTGWGNEGFIWVKYEDFANFTKYAYELIHDPGTYRPPTPVVVAKPDLSGELKLVTDRGKAMTASLRGDEYKMNQAYQSGTSFRIFISNNEPAYVYAIGTDNTEEIFQLFPYAPDISASLNYSQNDVALPSEDHYITMDNTTGTDYICVLYSKDELDIEAIKRKIAYTSGDFKGRVESVLGDMLVTDNNITFSGNEIGFKAFSKGRSIVALIVATDHI
ncbi:C1 family peptidase [Flammeovirgaceae bacterium SG7u.111]|nr:C1 family peptidase [Flammeovirgaceae bacterium SG7u.132]WPO37325.1 C1 family peptidase [Flammeovirgaceae bacterium SG7u.111]